MISWVKIKFYFYLNFAQIKLDFSDIISSIFQ